MSENMDPALLATLVKKYDRPGPRYTSYPTVPEWSDQYGPTDYVEAVKAAGQDVDEPLSFYLHIPFCHRRCWFCGCTTTVPRGPEAADLYLNRVEKEARMVVALLGKRRRISQFHWGGGTPSFLSDDQTIRAFNIFENRFQIAKDAEVSIEIDPRATTKERIGLLKSLGFNRLSFGIQDFDPEVQAAIGRNQDAVWAIQLYRHCRAEGFTGINFDLIYGLPRQTVESFGDTLQRVVELKPDRIAMYSYAHLPLGRANQKKIDEKALPTAEVKSDLFNLARRMFGKGGYQQIGMDHFVLPGDELALAAELGKLRRNFMGYTVNAARDWVGIGMSSISYINNNFAQNYSGLDSYSRAIDNNNFATFRGMKLSPDDLVRQYVIAELMCNFRLDKDEVSRRFTIDTARYFEEEFRQLAPFIADGLIENEAGMLKVTSLGRIFVRNIAMTFDSYLRKSSQDKPKVQFSRTI